MQLSQANPKGGDEMDFNDRAALVRFHAELRAYCNSIEFRCDGGSGPDCPFVEYCFRAAGELSDEAVAQAFDALTDGTPEGICGRVLASRRNASQDVPHAGQSR